MNYNIHNLFQKYMYKETLDYYALFMRLTESQLNISLWIL